jgi:hypothetical protein
MEEITRKGQGACSLIGNSMTEALQLARWDSEADNRNQTEHSPQPECNPPQEIKQDPLNHFRSMRPAVQLEKLRSG